MFKELKSILMEWWFFLNNHRWGIGNITLKLWYLIAVAFVLLDIVAAFVLWTPLLILIVLLPSVVIVQNLTREVWASLQRIYEREEEDDYR